MARPKGSVTYKPADYQDEIVAWISAGKPLREYCRQEGKPGRETIRQWELADPAFSGRIARAREDGEDVLAEEILEIADDASNDWMERTGKDGESAGWELNGEHVQRSKLRIEARLKLLAKWNPRKWGERQTIEHEGKVSVEQMLAGTWKPPAKPTEAGAE